jgi:hypothetical protein
MIWLHKAGLHLLVRTHKGMTNSNAYPAASKAAARAIARIFVAQELAIMTEEFRDPEVYEVDGEGQALDVIIPPRQQQKSWRIASALEGIAGDVQAGMHFHAITDQLRELVATQPMVKTRYQGDLPIGRTYDEVDYMIRALSPPWEEGDVWAYADDPPKDGELTAMERVVYDLSALASLGRVAGQPNPALMPAFKVRDEALTYALKSHLWYLQNWYGKQKPTPEQVKGRYLEWVAFMQDRTTDTNERALWQQVYTICQGA